MWKALRGRRRAVRGRVGAEGLRKGGRGGCRLASARKGPDPGAAGSGVSVSQPSHPITPNREMPRVAEPASLLPGSFARGSGGSGTTMNDDGWGGTDQLHSGRKKKGGVAWPDRSFFRVSPLAIGRKTTVLPSRDTAALAPPKFSNINRATRPPFLSFSFFLLCAASTYYTNTPVLLRSWLFGTIHGHCSVSCGPEQTYCKTGISYQSVHREAPTQGSVVVLKLDIPPIS